MGHCDQEISLAFGDKYLKGGVWLRSELYNNTTSGDGIYLNQKIPEEPGLDCIPSES